MKNSNDSSPQPFSSSTATDQTNAGIESKNAPASTVASEIFAANKAENKVPARGTAGNKVTGPSYKPSGRIGDLGLPLLLLWPFAVGAGIGYVYWLISQQTNPLFFSQMFLGIALGLAMFPAIRLGKCRSTRAAVASACVAAFVALLLWHALQARQMRTDYIDYVTKLFVQARLPAAQARAKAEKALTPQVTARLYLKERTKYGVTLREQSSTSSSYGSTYTSATRVVGVWFWVLCAFELLLTALLASVAAQIMASLRFNEERDAWYRKRTLATVQPSRAYELLQFMKAGQWREAGALARSAKAGEGYLVTIYDCAPASNGVVTVTQSVNKQTHYLLETPVSQQEIALLRGTL